MEQDVDHLVILAVDVIVMDELQNNHIHNKDVQLLIFLRSIQTGDAKIKVPH